MFVTANEKGECDLKVRSSEFRLASACYRIKMIRCIFLFGMLYLPTEPVYSQNVTQYENEGDTAILKCPLTPPVVSGRTTWRGPPTNAKYFINDGKSPSVDREERLSVIRNTASGAYNLRITNLTIGVDDGMFSCEVNTNSTQQYIIILKFYIAVHNISLQPSYDPLSIIEGSTTSITCEVNQNAAPSPDITWYLNSIRIGTNKTSINIIGNRTDNGKTLECRASNNNTPPPKTARTSLNVEYSPSLNALYQRSIVEGRDLSVTCQATPGNPSSYILYWTKVDNPGLRQNGPTLQFPNIQRTSSGTYKCTAENIYSDGNKGTDNKTMVVNVFYPPKINTLSQQDIIEGRDLSVTCQATPGYPSSTTFYWTKVDNPGFRQNGSTLQLSNIQRINSGTYRCTAENNYSNVDKGKDSQSMDVNVQYSPFLNALSQQDIIEGRDLSVTCQATPGNPSSTTFYWTKVDNPGLRQNGPTLQFPNIQRTSSGIYICTAENIYSNGEKGTDNKTMVVNVFYQPSIASKPKTIFINESEKVILFINITSNPLSNASWYDGTKLLKIQTSATTNYTIERASCEDSTNFSLVVSNGIGNAVNTSVELIVNCKPKPDSKNITLGVTDTTGIEFSSTVVAYPEPFYKLMYANGTENNQMMGSIIRNAINNFTYHFNQTVVKHDDYGTYHLVIENDFGAETIFVNVLPQKSPEAARIIKVKCGETSAEVQWISSFDGGDTQTFAVYVLSRLDKIIISDVPDKGENIVHYNYVENLQPSRTYTFYVSAKNRRGNSSSENITCITLKKDTGVNLPLIAGSAAAGGITLAAIVIVIIIFLRRYTQIDKQAGNIQRLKQEDESENKNVDGLKENSLYVSAGPRDDEKPEVAVYAAVAKKLPQSDNNSNLYADVKKSGRQETNKGTTSSGVKPKKGLFKKDEKAKHKKGKKPKNRPEEADVYENSEDIAMSTNVDNVYSNAAQKGQNKQKERGYKNKDGLLYVEVNFDGKQGQDNPVIHGEDEKTDYATVEFPMPSALHKASGSEEL